MKRFAFASTVVLVSLAFAQSVFGQSTNFSFSMKADEIRGLSSDELAKPNIPDNAIANNPTNSFIPRPLYLVYRYYSCLPWRQQHCRSVYTSVVSSNQYTVQVDTQGDVDNLQLVNEANEARLGFYPGTVAWHQHVRPLPPERRHHRLNDRPALRRYDRAHLNPTWVSAEWTAIREHSQHRVSEWGNSQSSFPRVQRCLLPLAAKLDTVAALG